MLNRSACISEFTFLVAVVNIIDKCAVLSNDLLCPGCVITVTDLNT